jgi:transmembrane sensor
MSTSEQQIHSAITQLAAEWFVAHRTRPLSDAERAEFLGWLKSSPVHIEEYLGIAALERILPDATSTPVIPLPDLAAMARDGRSASVIELVPAPGGFAPPTIRSRVTPAVWRGIAACALLCVVGIAMLWITRRVSPPDHPSTYQTLHGAQGTWRLPDGSTLRLDSDSAVTVSFSSAARLVALDRGQLWVAVAHDVHRPFRVQAGSAQVQAVGTQFDVYRMRDSTLVTVLEGQVLVAVPNAAPRALRVGADQEVQLIDGVLPGAPAPARRREATAWLEHKIVCERRPLGEIAEEFNRYNSIPFTIDDPVLRQLPISGAFDASDTESFAAFLQTLHGVRVERLPTAFKIVASRG